MLAMSWALVLYKLALVVAQPQTDHVIIFILPCFHSIDVTSVLVLALGAPEEAAVRHVHGRDQIFYHSEHLKLVLSARRMSASSFFVLCAGVV